MDYPKSVPSVGLVNGKFVDENPVNGSPGSLIPAVWGNAVTEELLNVVQAGGLQPSETARDQLLTAIRTIIQSSLPVEQVRTTLAAYGITDAYTKAEIEEKLKNTSALPVGVMVPFPKGAVPPGFLEVDHSVQSIAAYPDLYAYLGTTFNDGTESAGFFRLPESRGEFLRGWDHGRGVDLGRGIGSWQADDFKRHRHPQYEYDTGNTVAIPESSFAADLNAGYSVGNERTALIGYAGGSETRPRNLAVMWCIKAWNAPTNQGNIDVAALAAQVQNVQKVAVVGSHRGLTVSASGLNSLVTVAAGQLVVGNEVTSKTLSAVSLSINAAVIGVNGLDSGVLAASTWYSVWVVSGDSGAAGLLSLSTASPALPVGYTLKARIGWIRTDATANKYPLSFIQVGRRVQYKVATATNVTVPPLMGAGVMTRWTPISIINFVPSTATRITGMLSNIGNYEVSVTPNAAWPTSMASVYQPGGNGSFTSQFDMILESLNIYGFAQVTGGAISCTGWEDNL